MGSDVNNSANIQPIAHISEKIVLYADYTNQLEESIVRSSGNSKSSK